MKPASFPRSEPLEQRLLHVDPSTGSFRDGRVADLPSSLCAGDVVVVNDAATLPGSFRAVNTDMELRLVARRGSERDWRAALFGAGDYRTPTELRPDPPELRVGSVIDFGSGISATVTALDPRSRRLVDVRFNREGGALWSALYAKGRPIQYAYVERPLELFHVQNRYASRPWAVELPSAGRPLTWGLIVALRRHGIGISSVTHAAGLSSTGDDALDRRLPLPERFSVGPEACAAIEAAHASGGRVVAVGTTVVRALESAALANREKLSPTEGETNLIVGPGFVPRIVDGIFSGMHQRGTSHFSLLQAFAQRELLERALEHAASSGYLDHEFGDSCLILESTPSTKDRASSSR